LGTLGRSLELSGLQSLVRTDAGYIRLLHALRQQAEGSGATPRFPALALESLEAARPCLLAALQQDWPGPIILVSGRPEDARHLADQARIWSRQPELIHYFHAPDTIFYDQTPWSCETAHARVRVLSMLDALREDGQSGQGVIVTASTWALMTKSVSPMAFRRAKRRVSVGDTVAMYEFMAYCLRAGYESVAVTEIPGTYSHRGSIVDIYPPSAADPVRLDFFGDEIDSIRTFDPTTQRTAENLSTVLLTPASEALPEWGKAASAALRQMDLAQCDSATRQHLSEHRDQLIAGTFFAGIEYYMPYLYPRPYTLLDFVPGNALLLIDDVLALETAVISMDTQAIGLRDELIEDRQLPPNFPVPYLNWDLVKNRLSDHRAVSMGYGRDDTEGHLRSTFSPAPRYGGQLRDVLADVDELRENGQRVIIVTRQAERLSDLLQEQQLFAPVTRTISEEPELGSITLADGILSEGFALLSGQLVVLTDAEVFGWMRMRRRRPARRRRSAPESLFADLNPGDYVVHVEYGIGRYHGVVRKAIGSLEREYLELEYAANDRLFVPIHQADRVSRYVGADERQPHMHRLGGGEWKTIRERAERAVRDIAAELLELYAARQITPGYAFGPDSTWQGEMEASFPYEETEDQLRAVAEVKRDMELPKPMDRLICGDVGYGKTEVALRAAFKAVMEHKQVAVLVPTTVLAQQHFHTFRRRLRAFPVLVEMLSRFRSPAEQDAILSDLEKGRVDVIIGTHRLLSNDVAIKDLGLVIIDEEQRFGVSHKEHLKRMRREVDVLTLTATPIPRTLYMSLGGIRDMSIIDTPPEDRLAVRTFVSETDEGVIRKAILRELDRGGQVYFVHNRVQDMEIFASNLRRIVPEASVAIGHGQMPEDQLAQVMLGFAQGEHDVLLCTTIIESGLDIPNVNTLIVDRADTFGLAQLYQLRGRVGRGVNRAYAYLFFKPPLTEIARKRLQTIQEASELGAGFRVAIRDMEIRGAGAILGSEQHGHIAAIGFDLYTRMLKQAINELHQASGEPLEAIRRAQHVVAGSALALDIGPSVDLAVSAFLPDDYVPDSQLRLRLYRRMARVDSTAQVDDLAAELRDRFGEPPEPVAGLLYLLKVRVLAANAGVQGISGDQTRITISLPLPLAPDTAASIMAHTPGSEARGSRIWVNAGSAWKGKLVRVLQILESLSVVRTRS